MTHLIAVAYFEKAIYLAVAAGRRPGFLLAKEHGDQAVPCLILGFERTQELFAKEKAVRAEGAPWTMARRCPN